MSAAQDGHRTPGALPTTSLGRLRTRAPGTRRWIEDTLLSPDAVERLRRARSSGELCERIPEIAPAIGFDQESRHHQMSVDEHIFAVIGGACRRGAPLVVRIAALAHDIGKPASAWRDETGALHFRADLRAGSSGHEVEGARITERLLARLGYRSAERAQLVTLVREHMPRRDPATAELERLLGLLGPCGLGHLLELRRCDALGKGFPLSEQSLLRLARLEELAALRLGRHSRLARAA